jgi:NAD(P)H-flavin reductase
VTHEPATVTAITDISGDCRQYVLELETGEFDGEPGQHTSLRTPEERVKPYSVLAVDGRRVGLLIRAYGTDGVGDYMRGRAVGDTVTVAPVLRGRLTLRGTDRPAVFVATGTGITPLLGLLHRYLLEGGPAAVFMLGEKSRDQLLYKAMLEQYELIHPVETRFSLSRESWHGHEGYIQEQLDEVVERVGPDADYYLCGVPAAVVDARDRLRELGVPTGNVHSEGWEEAHVARQ